MQGTMAVRVFIGFLILYTIFLIVKAAQMELLSAILGQFMGVGVLAAFILFQQEIRKFLVLIGKTTFLDRENIVNSLIRRDPKSVFNITPILEAAKQLGGSNTGALIVFSKASPLKFYAETGDNLDAVISKRLLVAIFNKESPLHDGAVIIHNGRIKAARCILPVTENAEIPAHLGLRHRAAAGISEATDTLTLIVSEETGQISLAKNGRLFHNLAPQELRHRINSYLTDFNHKSQDQVSTNDGVVDSKNTLSLDNSSKVS